LPWRLHTRLPYCARQSLISLERLLAFHERQRLPPRDNLEAGADRVAYMVDGVMRHEALAL